MDCAALAAGAHELGIELTEIQLEQFEKFEVALYEANQVMNLTRVPKEECWLRHFLDSLLISPLVPQGASVLDIGTGPGFPAWPLACARPDLRVVGLDSSGKMLGFLDRIPLPNLTTRLARAEEASFSEPFDIITGRAVAPLAVQLELSSRPCRLGGAVVPMRTRNDLASISAFKGKGLGLAWERTEEQLLPGTDIVRVFPVFRKVGRTETVFPRKWAEIRRAPLK